MANGKKKSRRLLYVLGSATAILLIVIVAMAASHGGAKIDPEKLAKVERGDLAKNVVATGKIEPITKVEVKSKASGIVKKLLVDYGEPVKKGQVLAELWVPEVEADLQHRSDRTRAGTRPKSTPPVRMSPYSGAPTTAPSKW